MAVGFFAPEDDERPNGVYHIRHMSTTNSATQTPLQSPVSREYLVQAFCEALNRVSIAGKFYLNQFLMLIHLCETEIFGENCDRKFFERKKLNLKCLLQV